MPNWYTWYGVWDAMRITRRTDMPTGEEATTADRDEEPREETPSDPLSIPTAEAGYTHTYFMTNSGRVFRYSGGEGGEAFEVDRRTIPPGAIITIQDRSTVAAVDWHTHPDVIHAAAQPAGAGAGVLLEGVLRELDVLRESQQATPLEPVPYAEDEPEDILEEEECATPPRLESSPSSSSKDTYLAILSAMVPNIKAQADLAGKWERRECSRLSRLRMELTEVESSYLEYKQVRKNYLTLARSITAKVSKKHDPLNDYSFLDFYESIELKNNHLLLKTKDVEIIHTVFAPDRSCFETVYFNLGKFDVDIDMNKMEANHISIGHRTKPYDPFHPHIKGGRVCLGNWDITRDIGEWDIAGLLVHTREYLTNYNSGSPYFDLIRFFQASLPRENKIELNSRLFLLPKEGRDPKLVVSGTVCVECLCMESQCAGLCKLNIPLSLKQELENSCAVSLLRVFCKHPKCEEKRKYFEELVARSIPGTREVPTWIMSTLDVIRINYSQYK